MSEQPSLFAGQYWIRVLDGNDTARAIYDRHYSRRRYADGRRPVNFVGPGFKLVLLTADARAVFVWRKFRSMDEQEGINCAVFRNEGPARASDLVREADAIADARWPGERHYTYVNDRRVRRSRTPGRCFLKAGWRYVKDPSGQRARTKRQRLLILERPAS